MRIAIDVSQLAYPNTGVANYLEHLVKAMIKDEKNEFVLFFSSMRSVIPKGLLRISQSNNVTLKHYKIPPTLLHVMWNILHIAPIEIFVGSVDFVITSDWTEPPVRGARKATILYDLIVYKYPKETDKKIVNVQKDKLKWVKRESDVVFCISEATKTDALKILDIDSNKLRVVYPGF